VGTPYVVACRQYRLAYESPFTDFSPLGVEGVFSSPQVGALLAVLDGIRQTAAAQRANGVREQRTSPNAATSNHTSDTAFPSTDEGTQEHSSCVERVPSMTAGALPEVTLSR
jgi:hypothetical protein